jgi:hypothetical protein
MRLKPLEARYGRLHNACLAAVALGMIAVAVAHFIAEPANAPTLSVNDPRFVLFLMLAGSLAYFAWLGVARFINREVQLVIDHDGILLGFGRGKRLAWQDIEWVRLKRLGFRPQLQIGIAPQAFIAANFNLSMFNLDDSLRPIRGMPAAVQVRDNGLDTQAGAMLDAVKSFRPNLVRS